MKILSHLTLISSYPGGCVALLKRETLRGTAPSLIGQLFLSVVGNDFWDEVSFAATLNLAQFSYLLAIASNARALCGKSLEIFIIIAPLI